MSKFATLFFVFFSLLATASDQDPLWEEYTKAKITYQEGVADLLCSASPALEEIVNIQKDLQLTLQNS